MTFEYDLFLSYAREDENFARKLHDRLVADGHRVWWDSKRIVSGGPIVESIELGLSQSRAFGLVISRAALNSSWVKSEYTAAVNLNIREETNRTIVPILIENIDLPIFLINRRWADFRDDASFEQSAKTLSESLRSALPAPLAPLPEGSRTQLHEVMLSAKRELVISGHTLDKFSTNPKVLQALYSLFDRRVSVLIVLLNPHSPYALAHDGFHKKESRASARNQSEATIHQLSGILEVADHTTCFSVYLTRYMPRFRTILVDDSVCHVNLYMYGTDVLQTPELAFSSDPGGPSFREFVAIQRSVRSLLRSPDVIPLIQNGRFDHFWTSSSIERSLNQCIEGFCSEAGCAAVRDILLGSYFEGTESSISTQLCPLDYRPGTIPVARNPYFTIPRVQGNPSERIIERVVESRLRWLSQEYPESFLRGEGDELARKTAVVLRRSHHDHSVLWNSLLVEQFEDTIDRLICAVRFGHPEPMFSSVSKGGIAKEQILATIAWLKDHKSPSATQWLSISISAEALLHSSHGEDPAELGEILWQSLRSEERLDASEFYFHVICTNHQLPMYVVCFPSTLLSTLITLQFYDQLLHDHVTLHVDFVPRSVNAGTYASFRDVQEVLQHFPTLCQEVSRFRVHCDGPKLRAIDLHRLSRSVASAVERAFFLDVRGSLSFRSLQKIGKMTFFGFVAQERFDLDLVGATTDAPWLVFIRQYPNQASFELDLNAGAEGRVAFSRKLLDHRERWIGGPIASLSTWRTQRIDRFEVLRRFYTNRASQFHQRFGDPDEIELTVKQGLSELRQCRKVLVVGCGSGKEVHELMRNNSRASIIGIDLMAEPILYARSRYASREDFLVADYYGMSSMFDYKFDGLVANAAFVHLLERSDLDEILLAVNSVLEPGGLAFIRLLEKGNIQEELHFAPQFYDVPRWFVYYHDSEVAAFAERNDFAIIWRNTTRHALYQGINWLSYVLQKAATASLPADSSAPTISL